MKTDLKITTMKTSDLVPYAMNAKQHPQEQVDQIAASIAEFGMNDPIAVWHNADGQPIIVEGHGRLLALQKLGIEECPVISLDNLTDSQRKAYTLIHNKLTMNSGWDTDKLSTELASLADDFDFDFYGFQLPEDSFDFDSTPDLEEDNYAEPEHEMWKCPACGHVDRKEHYKKVS